MDLIKNLSSKQLKRMKKTLFALEFFGLTEKDISSLPALIKENQLLKAKVEMLEDSIEKISRTLANITDPESKLKKQVADIARDCFTLPEV